MLTLILKCLKVSRSSQSNMEIYKAESLPEESRVFSESILETLKTVSPSASKELSSDFKSMLRYLLSGLQLPS